MVDQLLRQSGTFAEHEKVVDTVMDNNAIERERGITILAKNCAVSWKGTHINIVDTPGHADFGGEVERALSMVDGVVLLIDAQEGPMPQTRFVTKKALALGLRPILVVNKVDKPGANPTTWSTPPSTCSTSSAPPTNSSTSRWSTPPASTAGPRWKRAAGEQWGPDMSALFDTILQARAGTKGDPAAPLQLQISALDYSSFVGRIGVGRVNAGTIKPDDGRAGDGRPGRQGHQGPRQPGADLPGPGPRAGRRKPAPATSC
jgi:GTP-binding protein